MTARVTTLKGVDAGAYYIEALPSYYLDADEPPGRCHGRGADMLGLRGEVRDEDFLDVMAGVHPGSGGVLLGRAHGESSVRGFDITANAPSRYRFCSPSATTSSATKPSPHTTRQ